MSDAILDILARFPKCRVTIGSAKPRKRAKEGDVKVVRGVRYVRRQRRYEGMRMVRRGCPVLDWVREEA